ncbi:DUF4249 domain-containing protein [Gelidibacter maritimus]|uniref:DUF4249 domain-containing protein n=1 Tax=Gelidibacter maritimus TaxID=2761487 RepID=A0A7W2M1P5_9FLAO|nr:DUF4249 domain-containing protein [Gelidibacter maritimus]MBA6151104.1 DUF4249 domain-containing protein [Gelidibacter maritimus]
MKKYLFILSILFLQTSCEDIIDPDLNNTEPKLVIEASINWIKGTSGNKQFVKLSLTAPYFNNTIPPANGATVVITDQDNVVYNFVEEGTTGIYKNTEFAPIINNTYSLKITYDEEVYIATETMKSVVPIDYVGQTLEGGFSGEDTELKAYYTDPADETNFYFFEFISDIPAIPTLAVYDDKYNNGNQIFGFYSEEDLDVGDQVTIRNHGVSERFYNYMFILLQQNSNGGGPFEAQPTTVRGNCINETNPDNFPLGYFRLSEVSEVIYTIQ